MRRLLDRLPRPARPRALALALIALVVPAAPVQAQRGGGAPPYGGPRPEFSFDMSDGEPVSFYLEWSRVLDLTPEQKTGLIDIRRRLRVQNAPFMRQLDSLREVAGIDLTARRRMTEEDREALRRFQLWAAPVIDSVRVNNDGARREIRALLDERQVARADSLNRASRDPRARRPDERGGAPGRRPPLEPDASTFDRW